MTSNTGLAQTVSHPRFEAITLAEVALYAALVILTISIIDFF